MERILSVLVLGTLIACIIVVSVDNTTKSSSGSSTQLEATDTVPSKMYSIAGFPVKARYTCIDKWKRCTNFWCDANCNHVPKYCPKSFCRVKPSAPAPAPVQTPAPCPAAAKMQAPVYTSCPAICTDGNQKYKDGTRKISIEEKIKQTTGANKGMVTTDQCANCFCSACDESLFTGNCGDGAGNIIHPTQAACSGESCCPATCLGGVNQVRRQMCDECMCGGCNPSFFGNNCGGVVPTQCAVTASFANERYHSFNKGN